MAANTTSMKPWADTPLALIPTPIFLTKKHDLFTAGASHMCMVHNSIFRGYNPIYHQAPHVAEPEKADFIGYCLAWHKFVKFHADNEDVSLFPRTEALLDDKTIFLESHKEHDAFMPGLANFQEYLTNLPSPTAFSGPKLLELMSSFQTPFETHMRSEITTIANLSTHPNTPAAGSPKEKATQAEFDKREGDKIREAGMTDVLPFFLFNFDGEFEEGLWRDWPPIPGLVRWVVMGVARLLHPGWWKFASCDGGRRRRELYALAGTE
ncbi:hypothetical protein ONS95_007269 [Cadophora gregata]|uniref:uncharacterized protein n=1 Tax=Cadophora gregata TaxID=51156 RepID=UPI0026DAC837|nr:uncharacterized protein ONS95_007269 [Cadophora gregata]KAK0100821.1 hypothetical protein ONS95_007269 [Cadophora gregata]KAK0117185.1 hypothetical protein ONS96_013018 [Cadophora gregata f. sp. sojae]